MKKQLAALWRDNKGFLVFIVLMFAVRSSFADWYNVPTGSMLPTIVEGDRIFVNKAAYRIDIPFTDISVMETGNPERGDIVVFESKAADNRLVKRVVGLPGDRLAMQANRLFINGKPLFYDDRNDGEKIEHLGDVAHPIQLVKNDSTLTSFSPVTVPANHILVLGDNRNNSADSRVYGFVPVHELQGKAISVIFSLDADNYFAPRSSRYLKPMI
ncbi:signal peptidase I [Alteromonas pelagimontana]|uniref:Signal peptidase I n=1 Tax=Alteromonas pelagimontana TaxID=1858656 RepID=A0A6M4MG70_9ALTE|nr:signal peptidase I [Alteromonas pelagimontana]QJR82181.1 signal peptidase I [Alteromonas pelagimontana]